MATSTHQSKRQEGSRGSTAFLSFALVLMFKQCSLDVVDGAPNYTSSDQSALLAFKYLITNDSNHILAANWSTNTSFCHWFGVSRSRRGQNTGTSLDLSNMGLKGTIPPQIRNLSFLTCFNISNNHSMAIYRPSWVNCAG
ncbi:hypothetical protein Vadar_010164 [Vaccinium darrowii]|uniref:Uncharacterized protein n=1 Tax=Vaccinium darrowii TaxID=229202 RepID=A0ACB7X8K5_9ERIC|nr:hypothetical protein Vadar_010164 [Vaccinium darrowii]